MDNRINEISTLPLTDRQKLDMMAKFWFSSLEKEWPLPLSITENDEQSQREKNATCIEDAFHFSIRNTEGVEAPSLVSQEARDVFLDELSKLLNEKVGFGDERRITFPEELRSFLKLADGVEDVDLRDEGICGWHIPGYFNSECIDMSTLRRRVRTSFEDLIVDDGMREEQIFFIEEHLLVKTDFTTGGPSVPDNGGNYWYSYYLFCRRRTGDKGDEDEESYESQDGWAWRIVFDALEEEEPYIFDSIPEFLEWYSSWAERDRAKSLIVCRGCITAVTSLWRRILYVDSLAALK